MDLTTQKIFVSEGKRPLWQLSIAALAFTVSLTMIALIIILVFGYTDVTALGSAIDMAGMAFFCIVIGIRFSAVQNIYFDLGKKKYKKEYTVGPVKIGTWKALPNIEYISVFRQGWAKDGDGDGLADASGYCYDVNVWYDISKHFTIYRHEEPEPAFEVARHLAQKLKVDLLDATVPNDFKWIELPVSPE